MERNNICKEKTINVYGTGGIGKSSLLDEYKFMAQKRGIPFILLESKEFPHTQTGLMRQLLNSIRFSSDLSDSAPISLSTCVNALNRFAKPSGLYIVFDTYEEWHKFANTYRL